MDDIINNESKHSFQGLQKKGTKSSLSSLFCFFFLLFFLCFNLSCIKKKKTHLNLKDTLRVQIATEPPSLDWSKSQDTTSAHILDNLSEGLTSYDSNSSQMSLQSALAKRWTYSNRGKSWTFYLRKGVKWTDGVEFTSEHVVKAWERLLNPKTAAVYAYFLFDVKNARAYNRGKLKDFSKVGVKSQGPYQVIVELEAPRIYFPSLLSHHSTWPIRADLIQKYPKTWTSPEHMTTLGAFVLKEWKHDELVILEKNPNYYGEKAKIKKVIFYIIHEISTALNLFDTGKLDLILGGLPSKELRFLKKRKEYREISMSAIFYIGFNHSKTPTDDVKVRRAIVHAINKKEIVKLQENNVFPIGGLFPRNSSAYNSKIGLGFDPKKAKRLLSESKYKNRKDLKIELMFNTYEDIKRISENLQNQLQRNLGIKVELNNQEWKVYLKSLLSSESTAPLYRMGWVADYLDPHTFASLFTSFSGNNYTNWKNKKYDELVAKAAKETDPALRNQLYFQIQKLAVEKEVIIFPIFSSKTKALVSERVKNYHLNTLGRPYFKRVFLH